VLAHHYTLAGDAERAVEYWSKAGRRSAERSSPREAIGHFEKALEVLQALAETADRHRQELAIRIGLVTPTMSLTGYASLETENALAKARAIADKVGETARLFPIVYGEWVSKFVRGQIGAARELAEHFLRLAAGQADTTPVMVSHRMLGATLTNLGELPRARAELETCIKLYEPAIHAASASLYGQDSRVSALCFLSWTLLISGDPGKALATAQQAVDFAGEIKHANTQGVAHFLAGVILRELIRDLPAAQDHTSRTIALAEGQGLAMWLFAARIVEGWLMAQRGAARAAVPSMRKAIEDIRGIGVCILMPHFLGLLADVLGRSEEPDSGLDALAAALAQMQESGERIWEADLQRLKGELLVAKGGKRAEAAAEAALFEAIGIARQQGARFWELRATTSLARLLSKQGKEDRAADLLRPICLSPDDVMVPDLGAARALLRQLTGDRPSGRS